MSIKTFPILGAHPDYSGITRKRLDTTKRTSFGRQKSSRAGDTRLKWTFQVTIRRIKDVDEDLIQAFELSVMIGAEKFYWSNPKDAYSTLIWTPSTPLIVGQIRRPITATGRAYVVTSAGTTALTEPTWPTTQGGTVVSGAVTFMENSYLVRFSDSHEGKGVSYGFNDVSFNLEEA